MQQKSLLIWIIHEFGIARLVIGYFMIHPGTEAADGASWQIVGAEIRHSGIITEVRSEDALGVGNLHLFRSNLSFQNI